MWHVTQSPFCNHVATITYQSTHFKNTTPTIIMKHTYFLNLSWNKTFVHMILVECQYHHQQRQTPLTLVTYTPSDTPTLFHHSHFSLVYSWFEYSYNSNYHIRIYHRLQSHWADLTLLICIWDRQYHWFLRSLQERIEPIIETYKNWLANQARFKEVKKTRSHIWNDLYFWVACFFGIFLWARMRVTSRGHYGYCKDLTH